MRIEKVLSALIVFFAVLTSHQLLAAAPTLEAALTFRIQLLHSFPASPNNLAPA